MGARTVAGQPQVNSSASAGLLFAGLLGLLSAIAWRPQPVGAAPPRRALTGILVGVAGAGILCLPPLLNRLDGAQLHRPAGFATWALVVTVVATAEEFFLRGVLFSSLLQASRRNRSGHGPVAAIVVTAAAFGLLHVPLYGWGSFPLDLTVGVWLGVLRQVTGTVTAPATAHVLADLAGWWLR